MSEVYIQEGVRTPIGKMGGSLKDIKAVDLGKIAVNELIKRSKVDTEEVDQVIMGQVRQSADVPNMAREIAYSIPGLEDKPAYTVHRQCGSGLQAIIDSFEKIKTGSCDSIICGGAENMSQSSYFVLNARKGFGNGDVTIEDALIAGGPGSVPKEQFGYLPMGITAENLSIKYNISRLEQDEFSQRSQERMDRAIKEGRFESQIVPVDLGDRVFSVDEHPFLTNIEKLSGLRTAFKDGGTVTAGNSSGRNDGGAAVLLKSDKTFVKEDSHAAVRILASGTHGCDPTIMGVGPVGATNVALKHAGLSLDDMDVIELNEAFAAQSLAVIREWKKISQREDLEDRINHNGGAIAHGHPLACTGAALTIKCMNELHRVKENKYGLITLCCAGGLGVSLIVEKVE